MSLSLLTQPGSPHKQVHHSQVHRCLSPSFPASPHSRNSRSISYYLKKRIFKSFPASTKFHCLQVSTPFASSLTILTVSLSFCLPHESQFFFYYQEDYHFSKNSSYLSHLTQSQLFIMMQLLLFSLSVSSLNSSKKSSIYLFTKSPSPDHFHPFCNISFQVLSLIHICKSLILIRELYFHFYRIQSALPNTNKHRLHSV